MSFLFLASIWLMYAKFTAAFQTTLLSRAVGVEVKGVMLGGPWSDEFFTKVNNWLQSHKLLLFKGQNVSATDQIAFTKRWGPVIPHPLGSRMEDNGDIPKEVIVMKNKMKPTHTSCGLLRNIQKGEARNDEWHSDISCWKTPAAVSVLHAVDVQQVPGFGDTVFANMERAWDGLPQHLRNQFAMIDAKHSTWRFEGNASFEKHTNTAANWHPVVRTHPHTCRETLYISPTFLENFEGMTFEESRPWLQRLVDFATKLENTYRHRWTNGDVLIWDNRVTMHYAVYDYEPGVPRTLHATRANDRHPPFSWRRPNSSEAHACAEVNKKLQLFIDDEEAINHSGSCPAAI